MKKVVRPLLVLLVMSFASTGFAASRQVRKLVRKLSGRKAMRYASKLADLGDQATDALLQALKNRSWKRRYWAAYALAYSKAGKTPQVVEALNRLLKDKKLRVRLRAAMALTKLGETGGLELAKENLRNRKKKIRADAVSVLALSGDKSHIPLLKEALSDKGAKVRYWALLGLRDLAGSESLPIAIKHMTDKSSDVQLAAMDVLSTHGKGSLEAEDALLAALKSRRTSVRAGAATMLGVIGTKRALSALRKIRNADRKSSVRDAADVAVIEIMKRTMKR